MSVAADTLALFRAEWESRLVDSCVVKRETGASFNASTGVTTPTYTTQYNGACLIRPMGPAFADFGEREVAFRRYLLFVPYDTDDPAAGDLVDVTSTRDLNLNGKQLVIRNLRADTYNTARRYECEDDQGG